MARLTELEFKYGGNTYSLMIDFDDEALVADTIAFDVIARRAGGKPPFTGLPDIQISARVEIQPASDRIEVFVGGKSILKIDISDHKATRVEELINEIPAPLLGDPITACAIKAGVSAIIGQAIACVQRFEVAKKWRNVSEFFRCMAENFGNISKIAMVRAFRCIANLK